MHCRGQMAKKHASQFGADWSQPAHDLWDVVCAVLRVARIDALGRENQVEILAGFQAAALEDGLHHLFSGAGIGRALQDDHLAGAQARHDPLGRRDNVLQVGRLHVVEGCRHADQNDVGFRQAFVVAGGFKPAGVHQRGQLL